MMRAIEVLFKLGMPESEARKIIASLGFPNPGFRMFLGCVTLRVCIPHDTMIEWLLRFQRAYGSINLQLAPKLKA